MEGQMGFDVHYQDNLVIKVCILMNDESCLPSSKIATTIGRRPRFPHEIERNDAKKEIITGALIWKPLRNALSSW